MFAITPILLVVSLKVSPFGAGAGPSLSTWRYTRGGFPLKDKGIIPFLYDACRHKESGIQKSGVGDI